MKTNCELKDDTGVGTFIDIGADSDITLIDINTLSIIGNSDLVSGKYSFLKIESK